MITFRVTVPGVPLLDQVFESVEDANTCARNIMRNVGLRAYVEAVEHEPEVEVAFVREQPIDLGWAP